MRRRLPSCPVRPADGQRRRSLPPVQHHVARERLPVRVAAEPPGNARGGETPIPEGQFVWRVFSTRGFYAGAIVLPIEAAQPYWIEDGRIIATRRDSLGVATIESYLLTPPT